MKNRRLKKWLRVVLSIITIIIGAICFIKSFNADGIYAVVGLWGTMVLTPCTITIINGKLY